jgi:DNA-binding transcriptional regulator of glucitol operon
MVVSAKASWIGLIVLFLIMFLIAAAVFYWQHTTGSSPVHALLSFTTLAEVVEGC